MTEITEKQVSPIRLLDKIIENLTEERLFGVAYQETRKTTEYDRWVEESISLSGSIMELLGIDRNLFNRYEELSAARESAFLKNAYMQGFKDGTELLKELLI